MPLLASDNAVNDLSVYVQGVSDGSHVDAYAARVSDRHVAFGYGCRPVLLDGVQGCLGGLQAGQGITAGTQWHP